MFGSALAGLFGIGWRGSYRQAVRYRRSSFPAFAFGPGGPGCGWRWLSGRHYDRGWRWRYYRRSRLGSWRYGWCSLLPALFPPVAPTGFSGFWRWSWGRGYGLRIGLRFDGLGRFRLFGGRCRTVFFGFFCLSLPFFFGLSGFVLALFLQPLGPDLTFALNFPFNFFFLSLLGWRQRSGGWLLSQYQRSGQAG